MCLASSLCRVVALTWDVKEREGEHARGARNSRERDRENESEIERETNCSSTNEATRRAAADAARVA